MEEKIMNNNNNRSSKNLMEDDDSDDDGLLCLQPPPMLLPNQSVVPHRSFDDEDDDRRLEMLLLTTMKKKRKEQLVAVDNDNDNHFHSATTDDDEFTLFNTTTTTTTTDIEQGHVNVQRLLTASSSSSSSSAAAFLASSSEEAAATTRVVDEDTSHFHHHDDDYYEYKYYVDGEERATKDDDGEGSSTTINNNNNNNEALTTAAGHYANAMATTSNNNNNNRSVSFSDWTGMKLDKTPPLRRWIGYEQQHANINMPNNNSNGGGEGGGGGGKEPSLSPENNNSLIKSSSTNSLVSLTTTLVRSTTQAARDVTEKTTQAVRVSAKKTSKAARNVTETVAQNTAQVSQRAIKHANEMSQRTAQLAKLAIMGKEDWTWEELHDIERRRRKVLQRNGLPFFRKLLFWDGTVISALAKDPMIYAVAFLYIWVRVMARYTLPEFVSKLGGANIELIGGFLTFFLIFYVENANRRFEEMYRLSMRAEGQIFDVCTTLRGYVVINDDYRHVALRLVRYLNAMHIAGYVGLSPTYTYENFFLKLNEKFLLLTDAEVERISQINMNLGGSSMREIGTWCMQQVQILHKADAIDPRTAAQLREQILGFRRCLGRLFDYDDQPVHFFYVHFVCLLSVLYLPLSAVQIGLQAGTGEDVYWANDVVTGLVVLLQALFILGLRLLADALDKPYDSDLLGLSVMHYINFTWIMSRRMTESNFPKETTKEDEEEICGIQAPIGHAWRAWRDDQDSEDSGDDTGGPTRTASDYDFYDGEYIDISLSSTMRVPDVMLPEEVV